MIYDSTAQIIIDSQSLREELVEHEEKISSNRGRDRKQPEEQAIEVRKKLLKLTTNAPTIIRAYFTATKNSNMEAFKTAWQKSNYPSTQERQDIKPSFGAIYGLPTIDLDILPFGSFTIQFTFTLAQPYLSKDDNPFYIIDNPIVRDKVFRLPMVRPTSWKGNLRHVLWMMGHTEEDEQIQRIFGDANDNNESGRVGRLRFYPTFFAQTSLEIINPHDRTSGVGKNPILLESVPIREPGIFTLLYTPLDRIGKDEAETCEQVAADLSLIAEGVQNMLTLYGFGAKTSSGFGLAEDVVRSGKIVVGGLAYVGSDSTTQSALPPPPKPELARYLSASDRLDPDFATDTGELKNEAEYQQLIEERGQIYGKKDKQLYKKAKSWWERAGQQIAQQNTSGQTEMTEPEPEPEPRPAYPLGQEGFGSFYGLSAKASTLAHALRQTGGEA